MCEFFFPCSLQQFLTPALYRITPVALSLKGTVKSGFWCWLQWSFVVVLKIVVLQGSQWCVCDVTFPKPC